jgi:integrase/recombinase XerD
MAGFLAGYGSATGNSYATDLRIYAQWCTEFGLRLFEVQRSHLELFGRSMEARGLMPSTVVPAAVDVGQLLPVLRATGPR